MTDGHLTDDSVVDGHLTDEQLSSHLDGLDAGPEGERVDATTVGAHLEECAPCRRRLAGLESVRSRLRGSVEPVAPGVRADSIAAVLHAVRDGAGAGDGDEDEDRTTRDADRKITPIPVASRRPQVLVGAAAAILVLAGAVGIPLALSHKGSSEASEAARAPSAAAPPTEAGSGAVGNGVPVFSDLGTFNSGGTLRSKVAGLLPVASSSAAVPTPTAASAATTPGTGAGAAPASTTAPGGVAATPGRPGSTGTGESGKVATNGPLEFGAAGPTTRAQIDRCFSAAARAAGEQRTLQVVATATFRSTPALVYVFGPDSDVVSSAAAERSQLVATARDGCKVLTTTPL